MAPVEEAALRLHVWLATRMHLGIDAVGHVTPEDGGDPEGGVIDFREVQ